MPKTKKTIKKPIKIDKQAPKLDRLPPQSIEAEQAVLGSLMLDRDAIVKISDILKPEDFYRGAHQLIFETMLELFEQGEPIDLLSISNRLEEKEELEKIGGTGYLTDLINTVPSAANIIHYAKIVQKKKMHRDLIEAAHHITQLGYQEIEEVENIVDEAEKRIFAVSQRSLRQYFASIKSILGETYERIDALHKGEGTTLRGISTGLKDLDKTLSGLQKSDFIILASRPGLGKTTLSLDIARHVATREKVPVGLFSLEMSSVQIGERMLAAQAEVRLWKLRTGQLSSDGENSDFAKINKALDVLSESQIFIDDAPASTVMEVRTKARRLQAEHGLGLIIIDYLQLMEEPRIKNAENMVQKVTEISRGLKALAKELNIPVLALSQLSRAVEQRGGGIPRLSDLRESGSLEQDADVVIFICDTRDKKDEKKDEKSKKSYGSINYDQQDENERKDETSNKSNVVLIKIAKHRNGPTGEAELYFNKEYVRFEDYENRYDENQLGNF
jgi:replicative DNA helicase